MAAVIVLQSNKGGVKLLLDDYEYCKVRESRNEIIVWNVVIVQLDCVRIVHQITLSCQTRGSHS